MPFLLFVPTNVQQLFLLVIWRLKVPHDKQLQSHTYWLFSYTVNMAQVITADRMYLPVRRVCERWRRSTTQTCILNCLNGSAPSYLAKTICPVSSRSTSSPILRLVNGTDSVDMPLDTGRPRVSCGGSQSLELSAWSCQGRDFTARFPSPT